MSRARLLRVIGLGIAVLVGLVLAVALLRGGGAPKGEFTLPEGAAIVAQATLSPREIYFGDSVLARVDIAIDRDKIDPDTVALQGTFAPYRPVTLVRRARKDAARVSTISFETTLRCLEVRCVPERPRTSVALPRAHVVYSTVAGKRALDLSWPPLEVATRIDPRTVDSFSTEQLATWRGQYVVPPPVSYRISSAWLAALLGGAGVLLILGGAGVFIHHLVGTPKIVVQWRAARLPPVERALRVLESSSLGPSSPARRRALDVLVVELGRTGEPARALEARTLAWADAAPNAGDTRRLVADVRTLLHDRENGDG
jgi:hypothetical protein